MSEPFIAEVKIFAGDFAPRGWSFCDGQLLPIAQNTALFSLIGTTFGGDGRTTTALPDLQGRAPMHPGNGPGLTSRRLGQTGGAETSSISSAQLPAHNHLLNATTAPASTFVPSSTTIFSRSMGGYAYDSTDNADVSLNAGVLANAGGSQSHTNMQPFLALRYIIALTGLYPSRS